MNVLGHHKQETVTTSMDKLQLACIIRAVNQIAINVKNGTDRPSSRIDCVTGYGSASSVNSLRLA